MNIFLVPLDRIQIDTSIDNRGTTDKIISDPSFGTLASSIKEIGLLHPITINEISPPSPGEEFGRYVVISGTRRFLVFKFLYQDSKLVKFKNISANIMSVSQSEANIIKSHENKNRENLTSIEDFEFKVSSVPFIFNIGINGDRSKNFEKGMKILSTYIGYSVLLSKKAGETRLKKKTEELKKITSSSNPVSTLKQYFNNIGESPRYFWRKKVIFEYPEKILSLYRNRRITFNAAELLNRCFIEDVGGLNELINEINSKSSLTSFQISTLAQTLLDKKDESLSTFTEKDLKQNQKTIRFINKMLKSKQYNISVKEKREISLHLTKLTNLLKGISI